MTCLDSPSKGAPRTCGQPRSGGGNEIEECDAATAKPAATIIFGKVAELDTFNLLMMTPDLAHKRQVCMREDKL